MTDNVITLPTREPTRAVWVCYCGCTTHYHHADGRVTCGSCDREADGASGQWRARVPDAPAEPRDIDGDNFKVTDINSADVFLRRMVKAVIDRPAAFVAIAHDDGAVSTWNQPVEGQARRSWVGRRLEDIRKRLLNRPD